MYDQIWKRRRQAGRMAPDSVAAAPFPYRASGIPAPRQGPAISTSAYGGAAAACERPGINPGT